MSIPPTQASIAPSDDATRPRHRARKRRKYNHAKESIYLAPEVEPYPLAIKPEPSQPGPSRGYAPIDENGGLIESLETSAPISPHKEKGKGKNKELEGRRKDKNPLYQAAALKAWETKRQRQKERFEALEASNSLLSLGWGTNQLNYRDGISRSGSGWSTPALDPLLDLDWDDVPDVPNDDLLQSLQSYSSRYYTANNLLLEPYKRIRHGPGIIRSKSRPNTPIREKDRVPDEESGSEYGSERPAPGANDDKEETDMERSVNGNGDGVESEVDMGPRKRGGQRGKRKLKDMYLALDGSALLTLGVLIQETIISRLQAEGYVPAHTLQPESEEEVEEGGNTYEVSDDESDIELESEEGQNENDDLYD